MEIQDGLYDNTYMVFLLHKLFVRFYEEKSTRGVDKMGFKRSFKIMPGVKLNINKKSVGMTLGAKMAG